MYIDIEVNFNLDSYIWTFTFSAFTVSLEYN